ncbi:hypothetical protein HDU67_002522 [Dinochytrium kinnereticum]|nr:hypothetical protein HDU67_002522 [Dinochytrium kinnereticum]
MEKLETFFGNKIPKQQKVEQSLVTANDEVYLVFSTENSDDEYEIDADAAYEEITTTNDLQPEQRRILNKRNKKLSTLLGENLDAKTISKVVTETVNTSKMILLPSDPTTCTITAIVQEPEEDDDILESDEIIESESTGNGTIIVKKKRLDKLSSMLGERIKVDDVSDSQAAVTSTASAAIGRVLPAPRILTPEERKTVQKRANKIERLMGALPPTEALISTIKETENEAKLESDTAKNLQKGIASISFFIENTTDVVDLLETLSVVSADISNPFGADGGRTPGRRRSSALPEENRLSWNIPQDEIAGESKESRQKRINKLRKFFGNDINIVALIENQLLRDIEQTVEEIQNPEERELLKENMKTLRLMMSRRSHELEAGLKLSTLAADNVYITSTTSPDSNFSYDNYTPRSTKPLVRSPTMTEVKDGKETPAVLDEVHRRASVARKEVWE